MESLDLEITLLKSKFGYHFSFVKKDVVTNRNLTIGHISLEYNPFGKVGGLGLSIFRADRNDFFLLGLNLNLTGKIRQEYEPIVGVRPFVGILVGDTWQEFVSLTYGYNYYLNQQSLINQGIIYKVNFHSISFKIFIHRDKKFIRYKFIY